MRAFARALYRWSLYAYPAEFRHDMAPSMLVTFDTLVEKRGILRVLPRELLDVLTRGLHERWSKNLERVAAVSSRTRAELWLREIHHGARTLVRSPMFTVVAVVSLALGIGANTAIFSLVNAMLLKPMPVERPDELVAVYAMRSTSQFPANLSYPNYLDLKAEDAVFADLVGFYGAPVNLNAGGDPELVWSEMVTGNYFEGLGVKPALGRTFLPSEVESPVVVLSFDFWQRKFDESDEVVGRPVQLNGQAFTIIGVTAGGFSGAKMLGFAPDLWVPLTWHDRIVPGNERLLERRGGGWLNVRGRLAPGVTLGEARSALTTIATRLETDYPEANEKWQLHASPAPRKAEPFIDVMTGGAIPAAAGALLAVVGIVLLVACANVASLQLARSMGREKEMALRVSLGASRRQLLRQLLVESLLLCAAAGAVGFWLSERLIVLAMRLNPVLDFAVDYGVSADSRVLGFTIAVSVLASVLSGLLPALKSARREIASSLSERSAKGRIAGRRWIVIPQLALSLVALVSAGLLVRSFDHVRRTSPGFETEGLLLASFNLALQGYDEAESLDVHRALLDRLRAVPGVTSTSLAFPLPLDAYSQGAIVLPEGADPGQEEEELRLFFSAVGEDYFETIGTPLLHGRGFRRQDSGDAPRVAVVNETLARRLWPEGGAVGKRFRVGRETTVEVVGVARDGKYVTLGEEPRPYLYLSLQQYYNAPVTVLVRTEAPPQNLEAALRDEVRALDPTLPLFGVKTMKQFLDRSLAGPRALAITVSLFAVLAVTLATIGIYGLMSFTVSQKRHELGIRMALGASRRDVLVLFVRQAARIVTAGVAIGLAVAWISSRAMTSLLYGVGVGSPMIFVAVALIVAIVALVGSCVPSLRATRLDPLVTLRYE